MKTLKYSKTAYSKYLIAQYFAYFVREREIYRGPYYLDFGQLFLAYLYSRYIKKAARKARKNNNQQWLLNKINTLEKRHSNWMSINMLVRMGNPEMRRQREEIDRKVETMLDNGSTDSNSFKTVGYVSLF